MSNNSKVTLYLLKILIEHVPKLNKQRKKYLKRLKRYVRETYPEVIGQKELKND